MKPPAFAYHAPGSVAEVVATLAELGEDAKVLAGGQSLVPMLNMRLATPEALVDLARVDGLDRVEVTDTHVRVEARVTHQQLLHDPAATRAIPLLSEAIRYVAHDVIRNRGTTVGSIAHGDPAAEMPAVLGLLGGHVELVSAQGPRTVTGTRYLLGPLESDTHPDELATAVVFPWLPPGTGTAFLELARRNGDYALAGVAVRVRVGDDHRVIDAAAAVIGVGGTPVHVALGAALGGQPADELLTGDAAAAVRGAIDPVDDVHATGAYRKHLAGVLTSRALTTAAARATMQEAA